MEKQQLERKREYENLTKMKQQQNVGMVISNSCSKGVLQYPIFLQVLQFTFPAQKNIQYHKEISEQSHMNWLITNIIQELEEFSKCYDKCL